MLDVYNFSLKNFAFEVAFAVMLFLQIQQLIEFFTPNLSRTYLSSSVVRQKGESQNGC